MVSQGLMVLDEVNAKEVHVEGIYINKSVRQMGAGQRSVHHRSIHHRSVYQRSAHQQLKTTVTAQHAPRLSPLSQESKTLHGAVTFKVTPAAWFGF